ncbi:MAG: hypothetical protein ISS63_07545 [Desulfobacteraceae bacterium]|nr:hypothetical protein [Desulfobacteraceae bacterium]
MKHKVVIVCASREVAGALNQFFQLFDFETEITPVKESSLLSNIRGNRKDYCIVAMASNQPSEWLRWLYQIRCVAKFRGLCALISVKKKEELEPAKHQLLFKNFMAKHQSFFSYLRLFDLLKWLLVNDENRALKPTLSYIRLRRMQRKIKGLYLPTKHGWGSYS